MARGMSEQALVQDIRRYHEQVDHLFKPIQSASGQPVEARHLAGHVLTFLYRGVIHADERMLEGSPFTGARGFFVIDRAGEGFVVGVYSALQPWVSVSRQANEIRTPSDVRDFGSQHEWMADLQTYFRIAPSAARQLRALWEWADAETVSKGEMKDGVLHTDSHKALRGRDPINDLLARYATDPEMKRLTDRILGGAGLAGLTGLAGTKAPTHEAYCLVCNGGGKSLVRGTKKDAERAATSHGGAYGHNVTVVELKAKPAALGGAKVNDSRAGDVEAVCSTCGHAKTHHGGATASGKCETCRRLDAAGRLSGQPCTRFKPKTAALGAAPGDVEGFVRELSDAAISLIEHAFRRAGDERLERPLRVGGKSVGARFAGQWIWPDVIFSESVAMGYRAGGSNARPFAYAWIARQFQRGANDLGAVDWAGGVHNDIDYLLTDDHPGGYQGPPAMFLQGPESLLGLHVWRIGRNTAAHWRENRRTQGWGISTFDTILEAIRIRLNWPRIEGGFDPPPPSKWPESE